MPSRESHLLFGLSLNPTLVHLAFTIEVPSSFISSLIQGIFSGFFFVNMKGSWNGTTFTITVNDTNPRFFYMIKSYAPSNCSSLGTWSTDMDLPDNGDVLFALNPVFELSSLI